MKSHEDKVKMLYGILSKVYDLMDVLLFSANRPNPRKGLTEKLPDMPLKILDVCCGTGSSSIAMAERNLKHTVIGIDITENMLKVARRKAKRKQLSGVTFKEMNAAKMDFGDSEFDYAAISLALHEMPIDLMSAVLSEMERVLKPGGKLFIIEWEKPSGLVQKLLFGIFPALFEPKGFKDFMKIDWQDVLEQHGLVFESSEHYTITRLITAGRA